MASIVFTLVSKFAILALTTERSVTIITILFAMSVTYSTIVTVPPPKRGSAVIK